MLWLKIITWLKGQLVGTDVFGNRYYRRINRRTQLEKRWVVYKGYPEASKIPAEWHGWLHSTFNNPPSPASYRLHPWQKTHLPNLSGTTTAYSPIKYSLSVPHVGDYQAWDPQKE